MGAGASSYPGEGRPYHCHECARQVFIPEHVEVIHCPHCRGSFLEESMDHAVVPFRGGGGMGGGSLVGLNSGSPNLNLEQSRRLANAALMLRLLEVQLREELEQLQTSHRDREEKPKKLLTKCMMACLRNERITVETLQEQPVCPICSEDYEAGECLKVLPCNHYYHGDCVMPWLEMKKTCPICRMELEDKVPPIEDLEKLSKAELEKHFSEHDIAKPQGEDDDYDHVTLVKIVHNYYVKDQEENERLSSDERERSSAPAEMNAGDRLGRLLATLREGGPPQGQGRDQTIEGGDEGEGEGTIGAALYGNAPNRADDSQMRIVRRPVMVMEREFDRHFPVDPRMQQSMAAIGNSGNSTAEHPAMMMMGGMGGGMGVPVNRTFILRSNGPNGSASVVPVMQMQHGHLLNTSHTYTPVHNTTPADHHRQEDDAIEREIDMVD